MRLLSSFLPSVLRLADQRKVEAKAGPNKVLNKENEAPKAVE